MIMDRINPEEYFGSLVPKPYNSPKVNLGGNDTGDQGVVIVKNEIPWQIVVLIVTLFSLLVLVIISKRDGSK